MKRNEALTVPLTPEEKRALGEKMGTFFKKHAARYTDSTSLPVETAKALLDSVCFCLGLERMGPEALRRLLGRDWEDAFREGQEKIQKKLCRGKGLWSALCTGPDPALNLYRTATLRGIGTFWKRYDPWLFACAIPCEIDYPLSCPVSEEERGIDYILCYLERLTAETEVLERFSPEELRPVLERCCPDWQSLPVNLFEPVAAAVVGRALVGEGSSLALSSRECLRLTRELAGKTEEEMGTLLRRMAERAAGRLSVSAAGRDALCGCALRLAPWVLAARSFGGMEGIFLAGD